MQKNIWILSAYRSDSHASWSDWLVDTFHDFNWHKIELPGRHFRWRIRGNPLSWLHRLPVDVPDLIVATSMVDLSTLKGLHPRLSNVPTIYYFHENQFAYPVSEKQIDSVEPKMVQLYGALAADKLVFNSKYNMKSFLSGVDGLLKLLPDEVPSGVVDSLRDKSDVLSVAIDRVGSADSKDKNLILWNHRWEYDKAPQIFLEALRRLSKITPDFKLALLGNRPKVKPASLNEIEQLFADKIIVNEKVGRQEYRHYLGRASVVVSTAIHEFQGLSMLEAVSAGAIPLVPDDLCYREQYEEEYRYPVGDSVALANKIADCLVSEIDIPDVSDWYDEKIIENWCQLLKSS